jgi:hypothetical protein
MELDHPHSEVQPPALVVTTDLTAWLWCAW